eukprot:scaffold269634_cov37-Prasinocladus_malaysianus.AAC.1
MMARGLAAIALGCNNAISLSAHSHTPLLTAGIPSQPVPRHMSAVPAYEELSMPSLSPTMTQ